MGINQDIEGNGWIKAGVDPYLALVDDTTGKGARMRFRSTPGSDEGLALGAMSDEASSSFSSDAIFFDLVKDRISIGNSAYSDMVGPGILIAGDNGELRFRTIGNDDYLFEHTGDDFRIQNYTDSFTGLFIDGTGKVAIGHESPDQLFHVSDGISLFQQDVVGQAFPAALRNLATSTIGNSIVFQQVVRNSAAAAIGIAQVESDVRVITAGSVDGRLRLGVTGNNVNRQAYEIDFDTATDFHIWRSRAGTEEMRLTTTGFGIGTTAASKLHVVDDGAEPTQILETSVTADVRTMLTLKNLGASAVGTGVRISAAVLDDGAAEDSIGQLIWDIRDITAGAEDSRCRLSVDGGGADRLFFEADGDQAYIRQFDPSDGTELTRLTATGFGIGGTATSKLHTFGSFARTVRTTSIATTLDADDSILVCDTPTGGSFTVTLPPVSGISDRIYTVKNIGTNASQNMTLAADGAETIDGSGSVTISFGNALDVVTDGVAWVII